MLKKRFFLSELSQPVLAVGFTDALLFRKGKNRDYMCM